MADYLEYDLDNIESIKNTVRYTVQNKVTFQIRVVCHFICKMGDYERDVDGFSHAYYNLQYEKQLSEAINDAYRKLNCSPKKFYPKWVSVIEYKPQTPYLDDVITGNMTYLQAREKYGKGITKTQLDIMNKLIKHEPLTKNQVAKAYRINEGYGKALKRISEETGNRKDYDNSVKQLEREKNKAVKEKKDK